MVLSSLLGGFIVILVGVTLIPTVANQVYAAQFKANASGSVFGTNVTGAAASLVDLTTLFFAIGVMAAGVALTVNGLRNAGML